VYPAIGELVGVPLRTYGLFAAIGLGLGLVVVLRLGRQAGVDRKRLVDLVLWVLIGSLLVSKLAALAVDWRGLSADPWTWLELLGRPVRLPRVLAVWQGGLVYYGGLAGGVLAAVVVLRTRRALTFAQAGDVIAPGLALGHAWGRLGCFLAGCCFGKAGGGALGVAFGPDSEAYGAHQARGLLRVPYDATYPLHPTQLYEAGVELAIAAALLLWVLPRRRVHGQVALVYLAAYSAARLVLEVFRGDLGRGFLSEPIALVELNRLLGVDGGSPTVLTLSQGCAVVALLVCGWIWLLMSSRRRRSEREGRRPSTGEQLIHQG